MNRIAYLDGIFMPYEEARIPLDDRALFFGDAVYDACLGMHGQVHTLEEHIERLLGNARTLRIPCRSTASELAILLKKASAFFEETCFLYIQLSRTAAQRSHAYPDDAGSRLLITASPIALPCDKRMLRLMTVKDRRYGLCSVKTVNLLPNVLASREAAEQEADEAVFVKDGYVTECAHSNISILKDGVLITHPTDGCILPGITRRHLLLHCEGLHIPVMERAFTPDEMMTADDILVSSSSKLCMRVSSIDGRAVGGRSVLAEQLCCAMRAEFLKEIRE